MVSIITVLVNAVLNVVLVRVLGYRGLALGTSIAALFNAGDAPHRAAPPSARHPRRPHPRRVREDRGRRRCDGARRRCAEPDAGGTLPGDALLVQIVRLSITIGVALVVLGVASWLLRIREFNAGMALVQRRLGRRSR